MSLSVAFIGNAPPRLCGIATFTSDLHSAVITRANPPLGAIFAMSERRGTYRYPRCVAGEIEDACAGDYAVSANRINAGRFDVVSLQHEFGIFGGEAGGHILGLLGRLRVPVVSTLHTVLSAPDAAKRAVFEAIIRQSSKVVVMAERGREVLRSVYRVPAEKIQVIAHGAPDRALVAPESQKAAFGLSGRSVALTFGLLSPNKGIEVMIDAMAQIVRRVPNAVYLVVGATHPSLVRHEGERYRRHLEARVLVLGLGGHVRFVDQFVDQALLLRYIAAADVYVTPYLTKEQMTSGTLAYSFALGKAIVSTPYWHAAELLANGLGRLVPFGDVSATADAVGDLMCDHAARNAMQVRAYRASRSSVWSEVGRRYLEVFESVVHASASPKLAVS